MPVAAVAPTPFQITFGDVLTAHLRNVREHMPIEQAYDGTRILSQLEVDRERAINGGGYIQTQVSAMTEPKGDWYKGEDTIAQTQSKEDTMAITELRFVSEPIRVTREEVLKANGDRALFAFAENKHNQGMRRLRYKIELALMAATLVTEASGTVGITSLNETLSKDPTANPTGGTLDGIDRTTETWWQNQFKNIGSLVGGGYEKLEELSLECQKGGESDWTYGMCDAKSFLGLKKHARQFLSLNAGTAESALGKRMADASIPVIEFEGKPIFWSPRIPRDGTAPADTGNLFFIRDDALDLCVHPDEEFKLLGPFAMENQNQHGIKWHLMWAGQLCWKIPSSCGRAFNITD